MEKILEILLSGNFTITGLVLVVLAILVFLKGKSVSSLIGKRKKKYAALFEMANNIYSNRKIHKGFDAMLQRNRECLGKLRSWKREDHEKILSRRSLKAFYELEKALKPNPGGVVGNPRAYQDKQLKNIEKRRSDFVRSLQNDTDIWYALFMEMIMRYAGDFKDFIKSRNFPITGEGEKEKNKG